MRGARPLREHDDGHGQVGADDVGRVDEEPEVQRPDGDERARPARGAHDVGRERLGVRVGVRLRHHHDDGHEIREHHADRGDGRVAGHVPADHAGRGDREQHDVEPARAPDTPADREEQDEERSEQLRDGHEQAPRASVGARKLRPRPAQADPRSGPG